MYYEEIEALKQLLVRLKDETETYIDHGMMIRNSESYLLTIAIEKYIERYG